MYTALFSIGRRPILSVHWLPSLDGCITLSSKLTSSLSELLNINISWSIQFNILRFIIQYQLFCFPSFQYILKCSKFSIAILICPINIPNFVKFIGFLISNQLVIGINFQYWYQLIKLTLINVTLVSIIRKSSYQFKYFLIRNVISHYQYFLVLSSPGHNFLEKLYCTIKLSLIINARHNKKNNYSD